ncbi:MAG: D-alanyl-D-alanine carboxypeptidase [Gammaproteobacteria bacterium]|nr:D-alanyl-D-alanine carboxypeptidase [Gammaproteobacteria bacterium]
MIRLILATLLLAGPAWAELPTPPAPSLDAPSYILMDTQTGEILAEANADQPVEPASLTKIMTTYLAFRALGDGLIGEQDLVTISRKARRAVGSRMFVEVNSQVPVIDLLRGIIVQSGNDASIALAEHIAGNEESFAGMMNAEAERLGMNKSRFIDSSGLGGPDHYMSARDTAILSAAMINEFPELYAMFREQEYTWNRIKQPNRNRLLKLDPTVDGIKTGFTEAAQYCLAASAVRPDLNNMRLVSVVLGAKSGRARVRDSRALLNWGFRFFRTRKIHAGMNPLTEIPVWFAETEQVPVGLAEDLVMTLPVAAYEELETTYHLEPEVEAPLTKGQPVGRITVRHKNRILAQVPAVVLTDVPQVGFFIRLWHRLRRLMN